MEQGRRRSRPDDQPPEGPARGAFRARRGRGCIRARTPGLRGRQPQVPARPLRRRCGRVRGHARPAQAVGVRLDAGRMRNGLRFLCHRQGGSRAFTHRGRDLRAGHARTQRLQQPRHERRLHGPGRALRELR